jgi:hypothetical protein
MKTKIEALRLAKKDPTKARWMDSTTDPDLDAEVLHV